MASAFTSIINSLSIVGTHAATKWQSDWRSRLTRFTTLSWSSESSKRWLPSKLSGFPHRSQDKSSSRFICGTLRELAMLSIRWMFKVVPQSQALAQSNKPSQSTSQESFTLWRCRVVIFSGPFSITLMITTRFHSLVLTVEPKVSSSSPPSTKS